LLLYVIHNIDSSKIDCQTSTSLWGRFPKASQDAKYSDLQLSNKEPCILALFKQPTQKCTQRTTH